MIEVLDTGVVYRNPKPHLRADHTWHPSFVRLDSGELVVAFAGDRHLARLRERLGLIGVHEGKFERLAERLEPWFDPVSTEAVEYELKLDAEDEDGGRRYWIYGADPGFHDEPGTDLAAVHAGHIAVTPVHFDLTDVSGLDALTKYDLARLLAPAAREVQ